MKSLKYCISFLLGGIVTQFPSLNLSLSKFLTYPDPAWGFKSLKSLKSFPEWDRASSVKQIRYLCSPFVVQLGSWLMCATGASYMWFKYGYGVGDIAYATRNQLKKSVRGMGNLISTNCKRLFQRIGIVETKIDQLHSEHVSLTNLVEGIDLKVNNIEVLTLFSSKGISLLCKSLLSTHIKLYGENPKTEVVDKNGMFFGCKNFI